MKFKELQKMSVKERKDKVKELKMELVKSSASKTGSKSKQIRKIIARILTIEASKKGGSQNK